MKVRDIIKQLNKFYKPDDDLYIEYWDVNGLQDLYNPDYDEVMPKEAVVYIINQLDKYWHSDNEDLYYAVMDWYKHWRKEQSTSYEADTPLGQQYGDGFDDSQ